MVKPDLDRLDPLVREARLLAGLFLVLAFLYFGYGALATSWCGETPTSVPESVWMILVLGYLLLCPLLLAGSLIILFAARRSSGPRAHRVAFAVAALVFVLRTAIPVAALVAGVVALLFLVVFPQVAQVLNPDDGGTLG